MVSGLLFLLGTSVGSFINCVVYRLNEEGREGLILGRSICPKCGHGIVWYDNIPLLSFVLLKRKCRYCRKKISFHYPLVELCSGLLTVFVVYHISIYDIFGIYYLLITYVLIAIFLSDLLYFTIPDEIVYPAIALTILFHLRGAPQAQHHLGGVFLAGLATSAFFLALVLATKGRGMGLGDVKLAGLMGLVLGFPKIIVALYLAFLTGAIVGVILILLGKKRFGEQIPFGPFLAVSTIVALFYGEQIKNLAFGIWNF